MNGAAVASQSWPNVLIVEDHELLAQSLLFALHAEGFQVAVAALESPAQILADCERAKASVVLLDLDLGGRIGDGMRLIGPLRDAGARVLVVTGNGERTRAAACLEQGAAGVLPKSTPLDTLAAAIAEVARGRELLSASERLALLNELRADRAQRQAILAPFRLLTAREQQVLARLVEGQSCESIASAFYVSDTTVRTQIRGVLTKLGVGSQLAAAALARRAGWTPETPVVTPEAAG